MLNKVKILFLTTVLPAKRRMGSEVASQAVIDALVDIGAIVTVVGYIRQGDDYSIGHNEVTAGRRYIETKSSRLFPLYWFGISLLKRLPYSIVKYKSRQYIHIVNRLLNTESYDILIIDHVQMSWLTDEISYNGKTVGFAHNVEHQMYRTFMKNQNSFMKRLIFQREARLLEKRENHFANQVNELWSLTAHDAEYFKAIKNNGEVREIPLPACNSSGVPSDYSKEFDVGLIGSWTWKANEEGLQWFFNKVYPLCPPTLNICIAGSGAGWLSGRYSNVRYMGFVDDAQSFLKQARVIAIPTLSGGGIQIKTLDAIASGSRIVGTPLAFRGIADPPSIVSVAETVDEFAEKLILAVNKVNTETSRLMAIEWSTQRKTLLSNQLVTSLESLTGTY